jgi:hypothetical protein
MRAFVLGAAAALCLAAGCAPREAYFRPAEGKPVGRDGLVGVRSRVPPEAADNDATAVAAISPLVRSERDGGRAEIGAVIELRNKRQETVTFLPTSVRLLADGDARKTHAPVKITRRGRPVDGPVEIPNWHEATFTARFDLEAQGAFEARKWLLTWSYRLGNRDYPQSTVFSLTGPELARRSLSGEAAGLTSGSSSRSESGVPFLMDLPFLGFLFRGSSSRSSRSSFQVGPGGSDAGGVAGEWWPLE